MRGEGEALVGTYFVFDYLNRLKHMLQLSQTLIVPSLDPAKTQNKINLQIKFISIDPASHPPPNN